LSGKKVPLGSTQTTGRPNTIMTTQTKLIHSRRFVPLFVTQLLNAFNDNLFKNAMAFFVVYEVYNSPEMEGAFSALASAVFIRPEIWKRLPNSP
jgi:hypothetical protein